MKANWSYIIYGYCIVGGWEIEVEGLHKTAFRLYLSNEKAGHVDMSVDVNEYTRCQTGVEIRTNQPLSLFLDS